MPELPEVEIVKRGLEPAWIGKTFSCVVLNRPNLRLPFPENFIEKLEGAKIERSIRRGKYILVFLDNDYAFALHLGMSGQVLIYKDKKSYEPRKHDHVVWSMDDGTIIAFNDARRFGMVFEVEAANYESHKAFSAMGPEPLGNDFNGPALCERLKKRRGPIKSALLDQKIVAGVGNIYACEALYRAGVSPERPACDVSADEAELLSRAIREVLSEAIEAGGSTLKDYQHTDGTLGYFQHSFAVYDKEGEPCPKCAANENCSVRRIIQGGRSTFFCSAQQK